MMTDRYDTRHTVEGQYQPGFDGTVLLNQQGITQIDEMNEVELDLMVQLTDALLEEVTDDQVITVMDLCSWHQRWLGRVSRRGGEQTIDFLFNHNHRLSGFDCC